MEQKGFTVSALAEMMVSGLGEDFVNSFRFEAHKSPADKSDAKIFIKKKRL